MKRLIVTADDFGLSEAVNEAVERGHRDGILTAASLMVAGPAAADAVRRAKSMPSLAVGLHLVVIEGPAVLHQAIAPGGQFPSEQFRLGVNYFFRPRARRQLAAEIRAQFEAFAATGLPLDHANAHKHMHLHPTVGRLLIDIGREFGLRAVRVPAEWASPSPYRLPSRTGRSQMTKNTPSCPRMRVSTTLRATKEDVDTRIRGHDGGEILTLREGVGGGVGHRALFAWTRLLRRQARQAGLATNDHCFGIRSTGAMTAERLVQLAGTLPDGVSEIYLHPAAWRDERLVTLMPNYAHEAELAALLDPAVRAALAAHDVRLIAGYGALS
ncbi:MAG: hopanoid biosynthesis-associated protein HpnK [Acetobacteraceae bacterium]